MRTADQSSHHTTSDPTADSAVAIPGFSETSTGGLNDDERNRPALSEGGSSPRAHESDPNMHVTPGQATPEVKGITQVEQTETSAVEDGKDQHQSSVPSRFRKMLSTVETKLRYSGVTSHEAGETQLPRRKLVDEHGNCLLGCDGKCKCLIYPRRLAESEDESGDDLYLMSGALGDNDDIPDAGTPNSGSILDGAGPHKPDGNLCIRDRATARDMHDPQGDHDVLAIVEQVERKQPQAPTLGRRLSNMTLACRTMFDGSKRSKPVSDVQTPAREDQLDQEAGQASLSSSSRPSEEYYRLPEGLTSDDASWLGRM